VKAFERLDATIAEGADERALFARVVKHARPDATLTRFLGVGAYADAAIRLHRMLLPAHGFQLGETAARRGIAQSWRGGDAEARAFEAATPALALLRALAHARAETLDATLRNACTLCEGLGWYVTRNGGKRICRHGETG
jgi:hypothetical protein